MQSSYNMRSVLVTLHLLVIAQLSALAVAPPAPVTAQTVIPVAPFHSVELRSGVEAILRHGPKQRVTLLKGSTDCSEITITDGGRLVIDKYKGRCPRGYELEIEIVTPDIAEILVADGGRIQSRSSFPRQAQITTTVRNGGTIDIRSMVPDRVTASVEEGGAIFMMPQIALSARVVNGGQITYWGDARVESSVRNGGAINKGTAAEADKPLSELSPPLAPPPPVPPLRPIQPIRNLLQHQRPGGALTSPAAGDARDRTNVNGFGARLIVVKKPTEFIQEWLRLEIPKLKSWAVTDVERDVILGAFIVFIGCRTDAHGICDSEVDYTIYKPDGTVYDERKGQQLWKGPSPEPNLQLSRGTLVFRIGKNDPGGEYRVKARVSDKNANVSFELVTRFRL